ncbi:MAG: SDR family oxidoreductase, partial [Clostridia bacterium]|nr:SDR family oxidoreductase [Clostridia bacterium]
ASKAGVIQLTRALALEWARYRINVNAIGPGYIRTDLNKKELENEKVYQSIVSRIPFRTLAKEDDLSGALIYLASEASDYVTGHTLFVDGGWLAN